MNTPCFFPFCDKVILGHFQPLFKNLFFINVVLLFSLLFGLFPWLVWFPYTPYFGMCWWFIPTTLSYILLCGRSYLLVPLGKSCIRGQQIHSLVPSFVQQVQLIQLVYSELFSSSQDKHWFNSDAIISITHVLLVPVFLSSLSLLFVSAIFVKKLVNCTLVSVVTM